MHFHLSGLPALFAQWLPRQRQLPGTDAWPATCGSLLTLRPVGPPDASLLGALFEHGLSPASRRLRFHTAVRCLSAAQLAWLATADFQRHAAFIVIRQADGMEHAVAEGRWVRSGDASAAEFALSVADAWQHQGIGQRLLRALVATARAQGIHCLAGDVLPGNLAMQALARAEHFDCNRHPDDGDMLRAALHLAQRPVSLLPAGWLH